MRCRGGFGYGGARPRGIAREHMRRRLVEGRALSRLMRRHGEGRRAAAVELASLLLLLAWRAGVAEAHAHLVQADPAADAGLVQAPAVGRFWFDEDLNGVLSRVVILDSRGRPVTVDTGYAAW